MLFNKKFSIFEYITYVKKLKMSKKDNKNKVEKVKFSAANQGGPVKDGTIVGPTSKYDDGEKPKDLSKEIPKKG